MQTLSIKNANRILCAVTVIMIVVQYILVVIGVYDNIILLLATQISVILISLIGLTLGRADFKETLRIHYIDPTTVLYALLIVLCSFPIVSLLNIVSMFFVENAVVGAVNDVYRYGLGISLFVMAVLPAIGEELLIRGIVYQSYRKKSPVLAWILSAVIFGLMHMNFNQMPYAIFLGLLMVLMIEASDSILTSVCMHFFVNGISTLSGFYSQQILGETMDSELTAESLVGSGEVMRITLSIMIVLAIIMIPLILLLLFATCRNNGRSFKEAFRKIRRGEEDNRLSEIEEKNKIVDLWWVAAILIMVIFTLLNTFA